MSSADTFLIFDPTIRTLEKDTDAQTVMVFENTQPRVVQRPGSDNEILVLTSSAGVGPAGPPGRGIVSFARTSGDGSPGTIDTYTIVYTSGPNSTFEVSNGAGSPYTNTDPMPSPLGGLPAGTTFDHVPVNDLLTNLLYPYQAPAFTSFSMSGQANTVEVGAAVSGSKTFAWAASNTGNITAASVKISDTGGDLLTGQAASGSASVAVGTNAPTSPTSKTWTIRGTNTKSAFFTAAFTVAWKWKAYYGTSVSAALTQTQIKALAGNQLADTLVGSTVALAASNYKYIAIPTSWPTPSAFIDASTNLDIAMATFSDDAAYDQSVNGLNFALVSVTNANGATQNYRVYRSRFTLAGSINVRTA